MSLVIPTTVGHPFNLTPDNLDRLMDTLTCRTNEEEEEEGTSRRTTRDLTLSLSLSDLAGVGSFPTSSDVRDRDSRGGGGKESSVTGIRKYLGIEREDGARRKVVGGGRKRKRESARETTEETRMTTTYPRRLVLTTDVVSCRTKKKKTKEEEEENEVMFVRSCRGTTTWTREERREMIGACGLSKEDLVATPSPDPTASGKVRKAMASRWMSFAGANGNRRRLVSVCVAEGENRGRRAAFARSALLRAVADAKRAGNGVAGFSLVGSGASSASDADVAVSLRDTIDGIRDVVARDAIVLVRGVRSCVHLATAIAAGATHVEPLYPERLARRGRALLSDLVTTSRDECVAVDPIFSSSSTKRVRVRTMNLWERRYVTDTRPLDAHCACPCCAQHTRAYVHHLLRTHEILAGVLLHLHNLHNTYLFLDRVADAVTAGALRLSP